MILEPRTKKGMSISQSPVNDDVDPRTARLLGSRFFCATSAYSLYNLHKIRHWHWKLSISWSIKVAPVATWPNCKTTDRAHLIVNTGNGAITTVHGNQVDVSVTIRNGHPSDNVSVSEPASNNGQASGHGQGSNEPMAVNFFFWTLIATFF